MEIYFSVIQRKVLTPNDFTGLAEVEERLFAFERRYEQTAVPFEWKFTRHDLAKLMERLADKDDCKIAAASQPLRGATMDRVSRQGDLLAALVVRS